MLNNNSFDPVIVQEQGDSVIGVGKTLLRSVTPAEKQYDYEDLQYDWFIQDHVETLYQNAYLITAQAYYNLVTEFRLQGDDLFLSEAETQCNNKLFNKFVELIEASEVNDEIDQKKLARLVNNFFETNKFVVVY